MKINITGPAYPYRGGPASFNDRLARQFSDEGNEVNIITFSLQYPGILFPGKTQYTDKDPEGIKTERKLNSINPLSWFLTGYSIKKSKPDILLLRYWLPFFGPCFGTVARIVRRNNHTIVICIFDNVVPHEKRPGDKILTRFFTSSIDGAIVMSDTVREELKIFRKDLPVKLSPHPLFDNYGSLPAKEKALSLLKLNADYSYILFFGFIRAYKGLDLLIRAFSDERFKGKKLRLIVAGEFYEDDAPYRSMIRELKLEENIIFFDRFIKDDEVSLYFGASDLVVQPYRSATQSGVTQIAYHFEKPMVVTDVGGLREIVPDGICGYVVKPESEAIAEAIIDFFDNKRLESFSAGVKKEKEKFTWEKMTSAIKEVYLKCKTP